MWIQKIFSRSFGSMVKLSRGNATSVISNLSLNSRASGNLSRCVNSFYTNICTRPLTTLVIRQTPLFWQKSSYGLQGIEKLEPANCSQLNFVPQRSVVKYSMRKGKRKTVKAVIKRFFRLNWGIWIRPKTGRSLRLWKRSEFRRKLLRQHVFCNATQCSMLDKMVSPYWRRKKFWVDDPYNPYQKRDNFPTTRRPSS